MHWLAEVAAVAARLVPQTAIGDVEMLAAFEFPTTDSPAVIRRATSLAIETNHHLLTRCITPLRSSTRTRYL